MCHIIIIIFILSKVCKKIRRIFVWSQYMFNMDISYIYGSFDRWNVYFSILNLPDFIVSIRDVLGSYTNQNMKTVFLLQQVRLPEA